MPRGNKRTPHRISLLWETLCRSKLDGIVFFSPANIRYLSGFTGSEAVLLIGCASPVLFIDGRYTIQAAQETSGITVTECTDKLEALARIIKRNKIKRVGLEADAVALSQYRQLKKHASDAAFVAVTDEIRMLRAFKDDTEIALMKKAASVASGALQFVIDRVKPGWAEKELAWQLEIQARQNGADGMSFEPIVAAGENSSRPHARPTERKIKKGDFVVIDFGVRYQGYCSDETCTIAFGKLTDRQKNAYQIVKESHDRALEVLSAGIAAAEVDRTARRVFGKRYGRYFVHGTGHGIGLDVHEAPRLSSLSGDVLEPRMVFTIEPGFYVPGRWGIRIEDTVLLKENSCEKLTKMDKDLTVIE